MTNQSGKWKAESGRGPATLAHPIAVRPLRPSAFRLPFSAFTQPPAPSPPPPRHGVTLIELLITMAIMAIISAAILGTASAAMEGARRSRTQSLVTKIHNLITEKLASYETRRLDVRSDITTALDNWVATAASPAEFAARNIARGQMLADARLLAARELLKAEMPDRWEDIDYYNSNLPLMLSAVPSLTQTYRRRYTAAQAAENDVAECLYMTVMAATGDGEARTFFAKQEIGDTDESGPDGAPEFIDGWGKPIEWIRWPAGVVSDLQPINPDGTRVDHDPLDPYRRDLPTVVTPQLDAYPIVGSPVTFKTIYQNKHSRSSRQPFFESRAEDGVPPRTANLLRRSRW